MGKSKAPKAPDYAAAARETAEGNADAKEGIRHSFDDSLDVRVPCILPKEGEIGQLFRVVVAQSEQVILQRNKIGILGGRC